MQTPGLPSNEAARQSTLTGLNVLDTPPEERFDRLTRLAKRMFGVPIVLVSLVDMNRQWFKSCVGLSVSETPRDISFCGHAILSREVLLVPDATVDPRFHDNPLVTGDPKIRFYAGCPLSVNDTGHVGTLCLIDRQPRDMDAEELALLRDLARMAEQELAAIQLATLDELTGLSNRRGFLILARHAMAWCQRQGKPAALLFVDLDDFKPINDHFGHAEGDYALRSFAKCLSDVFRESDVFARLGGDEFVVLMPDSSLESADAAIERLRARVTAENEADRRGYELRFSVGKTAHEVNDKVNLETWLAEADEAMYRVKKASKAAR